MNLVGYSAQLNTLITGDISIILLRAGFQTGLGQYSLTDAQPFIPGKTILFHVEQSIFYVSSRQIRFYVLHRF